jgi:hypothetical protein
MLVDLLGQRKAKAGGPSQILAAVDDEGKITRDKQLENAQIYSEDSNKFLQQKIETIIDGKLMFNPKGDGGTGSYTIALGNGETVSGSLQKIRKTLEAKDEFGNYINSDAIEKEIDKFTSFTDQQEGASIASKQHPSLIADSKYTNFYNKLHGMNSISNQEDALYKNFTSANDEVLKLYQNVKKETLAGKGKNNSRLLLESGFPDIMDKNGKLSEEEYIAKAIELGKQGKLTNIDLYGIDEGTSSSDYMIPEVTSKLDRPINLYINKSAGDFSAVTPEQIYVDDAGNKSTNPRDLGPGARPSYILSTYTVTNEAKKAYKILDSKLKSSKGYVDLPSLLDARRGRSRQDDDLEPYPIYATDVNPASMSDDAKEDFIRLLMQKSSLESRGSKYGIIVGDQVESKEDYLMQSDLANKLFDVLADNVNFYLTTDKATKTSIKNVPQFQLEYSPVFGSTDDLTKSKASITIKPNAQWLNSFQKGGESFETGVFKSKEIEALQDGITIIFDQQEDVNPKARSQEYYSPLMSEVELSTNNFVDKKYPGIDSMPTGDYSITKPADDYYYVTYKFNMYQDGGQYTPTEEMSRIIDLRGQSDKSLQFDKIMNETIFTAFEVNKNMNDQKKARDVKMNGSK